MIAELVPVSLPIPTSDHPRSEGVHVSSVLKRMATEKGILNRELLADLKLTEVNPSTWWTHLSPVDQIRISMGLAWEEWYMPKLEGVSFHPGEMLLDGIYMTPDGESLDMVRVAPGPWAMTTCIHEAKLTYKSTATVGIMEPFLPSGKPSKNWMWVKQTQSYCKAAKTRLAYVHVLFVCGDYKYPLQPVLKCWRILFDQEEIDQTWEEITGHVARYLELEAAGAVIGEL